MPCCTLAAFLLCQLGVAGSALKVRLLGAGTTFQIMPTWFKALLARWRWAGMAGALALELVLVGAAAPYVVTASGRKATSNSFASVVHFCSLSARLTQSAFVDSIR